MAQIIIKDLKFYGFHGVYPEEQIVGTSFRADVVIDFDDGMQGFYTDRLDDALNYENIVKCIVSIGTGQKYHLIECLAQVLCEKILAFDHVYSVDVTIYKLVNRLTADSQWIGVRRCVQKNI